MQNEHQRILVTDADRRRLAELIRGLDTPSTPFRGQLDELAGELDRASIVPSENVPADVVTMNSSVLAREVAGGDTPGRTIPLTLVYRPRPPDLGRCVSVLSPLGIRLLGAREGAELDWPLPRGRARRLRIERIVYQPESAGHREL